MKTTVKRTAPLTQPRPEPRPIPPHIFGAEARIAKLDDRIACLRQWQRFLTALLTQAEAEATQLRAVLDTGVIGPRREAKRRLSQVEELLQDIQHKGVENGDIYNAVADAEPPLDPAVRRFENFGLSATAGVLADLTAERDAKQAQVDLWRKQDGLPVQHTSDKRRGKKSEVVFRVATT